jgi:hypothetical protein
MTPQEQQLLTTFLQQLAQTRADPKDPQADALIRDALSRQPDANYLLVQRAVGLELAVKTMQAQAEKLQAELDQAKRGDGASFLGNTGSWGRSAPAASAVSPQQSYGKSLPPAATSAAPASSWGSGMMANLATTAAGVVAGSFLYQGIQQLMGHHNPAAASAGSADNTPVAASDTNDALTNDEASNALDDSNDSLALDDDGGFDSPDLG